MLALKSLGENCVIEAVEKSVSTNCSFEESV
jgi:hypothetical protein